MASALAEFPPVSYSSAFYLTNVVKELVTGKKSPVESPVNSGDLSDIWKRGSGKSSGLPNPAISTFKKWRKSVMTNHYQRQQQPTVDTKQQQQNNNEDEMSLLKFLALNALDLTAPASDLLLKNRKNSWFQLTGHPDCFAPAGPGTIWKRRSGCENVERNVYEALSKDSLVRDLVPRYFREVEYRGESFIELQDLLHGFFDPCVIDIKMGTRTFLESEVQKTTARHDLYQKMVSVDQTAPTEEEHRQQAVTKLRYMQFREQQSSTCSHGFRIEAMKNRGSPTVTALKTVKSTDEILTTLALFLAGSEDTKQRLIDRLNEIRTKFEESSYFQRHEIVGSSLFMIYDDTKVGVWIIDFAKTHPLPEGVEVTHRRPWVQGNHEEGFLYGLDQLIMAFEQVDLKHTSIETDKTLVNS